jgi:uroporphyrinogen III methyltransferase/synthase
VALIADGTTSRQQVLIGTLEDIAEQAEEADFKPPAIIVVGEVVNLRKKIAWFESRPLFGKRVLVTRTRRQAKDLSRLLLECGAVPVEVPVIKIQPLADFSEFDREVLNLKNYHWIIFTSINGAEAFFTRLSILGLDSRWLNGISIGTIGPATARALEKNGVHADFVPDKYTSRGLVAGLKHQDISGKRILLPRADIAGKSLADGLASLGAQVREVIAYRTIPDDTARRKLEQMLKEGQIDIVTFASASAVKSLLSRLGKKTEIMNRVLIACIGPETEAALKKAGLRAGIVAQVHTMAGLLEAMEQYFLGVRDG